jgi:hypothetical protein
MTIVFIVGAQTTFTTTLPTIALDAMLSAGRVHADQDFVALRLRDGPSRRSSADGWPSVTIQYDFMALPVGCPGSMVVMSALQLNRKAKTPPNAPRLLASTLNSVTLIEGDRASTKPPRPPQS